MDNQKIVSDLMSTVEKYRSLAKKQDELIASLMDRNSKLMAEHARVIEEYSKLFLTYAEETK